ncbi:MAG: 5-formyltetrahydrofolate cyclo-ligase [Erysipelotrichaceae bacterium]|nr:5-formyltetrahydrofolate cyclo-ligase [Erysipelotrichaceae bacterium]
MKKKRQDLDETTFLLYSQSIKQTLTALPVFKQARRIGIYISVNHEVDTLQLINEYCQDKDICVPKVHGQIMDFYHIKDLNETKAGAFGLLEPVTQERVDPDTIDLMIVPLLAYDLSGQRIGYGGGYYDRYLPHTHCPAIGLAFSFQYLNDVEAEAHDQPLNMIITEQGAVSFDR